MEEKERLSLINDIEEEYNFYQSLEEKQKRLKELSEDLKVKEYFKLEEEVKDISLFRSINPDVYTNLTNFFCDRVDRKLKNTNCKHNIYIYAGSYEMYWLPYEYEYIPHKVENESSENFDHNKYVCLHCGKKVEFKDWEEFEKNNNVLKNYKITYPDLYYRQMYFKYLYTHSFEESQAMVIEQFKKDLNDTSTKRKILSNN